MSSLIKSYKPVCVSLCMCGPCKLYVMGTKWIVIPNIFDLVGKQLIIRTKLYVLKKKMYMQNDFCEGRV